MVQTARKPRSHRPAPAREPLTRERIVETALTYCDTHGYSAMTMRSLAAELGVQPMSLYHHVEGREGIIAGMIEAMLAQTEIAASASDWREWVDKVFDALRSIARRHPGALEVVLTAPTSGPTARRASHVGLEVFMAAGFTALESLQAVGSTSLAALGLAGDERLSVTAGDHESEQLAQLRVEHVAFATTTRAELESLDIWEFTKSLLVSGFEARLSVRTKK